MQENIFCNWLILPFCFLKGNTHLYNLSPVGLHLLLWYNLVLCCVVLMMFLSMWGMQCNCCRNHLRNRHFNMYHLFYKKAQCGNVFAVPKAISLWHEVNICCLRAFRLTLKKREKTVLEGKYCPTRKTARTNMVQSIDMSLVTNIIERLPHLWDVHFYVSFFPENFFNHWSTVCPNLSDQHMLSAKEPCPLFCNYPVYRGINQ